MNSGVAREDFTVREVADLMAVNPETVRMWMRSGRLKGYKAFNGQWRIPREEVARARGVRTGECPEETGTEWGSGQA